MAAPGTSSELVHLNSLEIDSDRNILSILIRRGFPCQLPELASSSAFSQNLVEFVCRITGSSLTSISGGVIGFSDVPGDAFVEFMIRNVPLYVPRDVLRFSGLRRVSLNVSVTYARKRKARVLDNAAVLMPSSKRMSLFTHKSCQKETMKNKGVPVLSTSSNEIPRKVTFDISSTLKNEQHSVGMDTLDCCAVGSDLEYDFSVPPNGLNFFDFGNISCVEDEDTRASAPYITRNYFDFGNTSCVEEENTRASASYIPNSVFPHKKEVDFSYVHVSPDIYLDANSMKEQTFQRSDMVENNFRPSLDRMLDQPSLVNQILDDDFSTLSLELGFLNNPEVHAIERLNMIEKDFKASLMENPSLLERGEQPASESIYERMWHSKNDKLNTAQESNEIVASWPTYWHRKETSTLPCAFGDGAQSSSPTGLQIVAGSNIASSSTFSMEEHDKNVENPSKQKFVPNFESCIIDKLESSGGCGTVYTTKRKEDGNIFAVKCEDEGLPQLSLSNEVTRKSSQEQKLIPNFEPFIIRKRAVTGKGEFMKDEGSPKLLSLSDQIPRKVNFDFPNPLYKEQHSVDMGTLDCSTIRLGKSYDLPSPLHDLSYFEFRNISYNREEDTRESSTPCFTKVDFSEVVPIDIGLNANLTKEDSLQKLTAVEHDFRPLLDRVLDQPTVENQAVEDDFSTLSLELGHLGIPKVHAHERLGMFEKYFEKSLLKCVWDKTELHHVDNNDQNVSLMECRNQLVNKVIDERTLHSKYDKLIAVQLESKEIIASSCLSHCNLKKTPLLPFAFVDAKKSTATEPATLDVLADVSEEKQGTFNYSSIKDCIASAGQQNLVGSNFVSNSTSSTKDHDRSVGVSLVLRQPVKAISNINVPSKESTMDAVTKLSKNSSEPKLMPNFESFIIEEEEGSGGYGTVYKAQRKEDGKIFAVKCPHANAHSHHIYNELKMLERFGGRNFVIKYEGSFKNGDSECFVLEHVEHDRPEILKKEIGLFELQWYGFCMFRALASLHKQGVVHRDVKPGNFLFSRSVNKGYLIDFNLASDLHQKFCRSNKRKMPSASVDPLPLPESKSSSSIHSRKFVDRRLLENAKKAPNESKKILTSKNSKKKFRKDHEDGFPIVDRSKHGSQTADVSGLTSTKDQTSNKTPVDWLNQPMPCKGRKELINFVHRAMHSTQNMMPVSNVPSSQRKRVAAPMSLSNDTGLLILTPMPLHSGGNAVAGAGIKNNASAKVKREGPCVGTKGFRAPEVLFKSFHQGCKIDIWSAGVTLLYLMIGRAPFGGDPEQNIKEIARLRGSEDLWEVAKLHNCDTSFPVDLLDVGSLRSMRLRDWCAKNTRRPDFLDLIPESLFDLVDRCLTVNPRCRLSAEEALSHKFFSPCHESIRKQRMLRKVVASSDPSSSNS